MGKAEWLTAEIAESAKMGGIINREGTDLHGQGVSFIEGNEGRPKRSVPMLTTAAR